jgi:hypothetical protein
VLKTGHFRIWIRKCFKVLKFGARERWRESLGTEIVIKKRYDIVLEERDMIHTVRRRRLNGLDTSVVGTGL